MNKHMQGRKTFNFLLFVQILSIYFGRFHYTFLFSVKPYMIVLVLLFMFYWRYMKLSQLYLYEKLFLLFMFYYSLTGLTFNYPDKHLRFIIANLVILFFYFTIRGLITNLDENKLNHFYYHIGIIVIVASFIYYIWGLASLKWNFQINNTIDKGVLVDRGMPRMIGVVSTDPNIFVFYLSGFLYYNFERVKESSRYIIGFLLSFFAIILSFSRGAIIATVITLFLNFVFEEKDFKRFIKLGLLLFLFVYLVNMINPNIQLILKQRFFQIKTDGGSGRIQLWKNALTTFKDNPIFGIGLNGTTSYGQWHYNDGHYVHNTFLEVLSESGIIGICIYMFFWVQLLKTAYLNKKYSSNSNFVFYTLFSMLIQLNFLSVLHSEAFYMILILNFYFLEKNRIDDN